MGSVGLVASHKACLRVLGSIAEFSEGIIFRVYVWMILKMDPEILLCVGNNNAWVLEGAGFSGRSLRGGSGLRSVANMPPGNDQSSFSMF